MSGPEGRSGTEHDAGHTYEGRREDAPLLFGKGTFIDGLDVDGLSGALHAVFVRSYMAHAHIRDIDITAALALPGVVAVFTGTDLTDVWVLPPRLPMMNKAMHRPMLAQERVRFVGEPVAVVLAETRAQAADAADAVIVDYEALPVVIDPEAALAGEVLLHEHAGSNVSFEYAMPEIEPDPFAACDVVVELTTKHPRLHAAPMEPRAGAVFWGADGRCTAYVNSQRPAGAKYVIECALGLAPGTVRAIAPDVGGGFGAKGGYGCHPEDVIIVWASRRLGRPVRWVETRTESMLGMGHGRASTHHVRIGGSKEGRIEAYEVRAVQDSGAYPAMGTFVTSGLRNSGTGVYDIPVARVSGRSAVTNTTPTSALRGAGRPEAACSIERAIDRFAVATGLDPVEIRLRNLVAPDAFPYTTAVGAVYDSGRYADALTSAMELGGYTALRLEQAKRRSEGDPTALGIGVSCTVESTGGGDETSSMRLESDGTFTLVIGTSPHGQAHATTFAAVVAAELGVAPERINVIHGDTDFSPFGGGTIGSRSAQLGGAASFGAARDLVELARTRVADLLEAAPEDIVFERGGGRFHVTGSPTRALGWDDLVAGGDDARSAGDLVATHDFKQPGASFAFGACLVAVEVDTETGHVALRSITAVDDAGIVLQPKLAEGQIHGGLGLAIAAALFEEFAYTEDGVPLTANFADYGIVSSAELPSFDTHEMETPAPFNPLGVKGVGESGTVMATPAIQSAVIDALAPYGVEHLDLPFTSERVWQAIRKRTNQ